MKPSSLRMAIAFIGASIFVASLSAAGCAPSPKDVSCTNDAACRKLGDKYQYCLEDHCVECVGNASCGDGQVCQSGACVCVSNRGCAQGQTCADGVCQSM